MIHRKVLVAVSSFSRSPLACYFDLRPQGHREGGHPVRHPELMDELPIAAQLKILDRHPHGGVVEADRSKLQRGRLKILQ